MEPTRYRARLMPSDGADASRRAIGAADDHPLSVRRFAPAIKRLQRTVVPASPLARPPAADPQRRSATHARSSVIRETTEEIWL
jgi:hypothetical protein